jgi:hypothetical protein
MGSAGGQGRIDRENELSEIRRKSAGLSTRDARAIRDAVPGVERVVAKIEVEAWKVLSSAGRAKPRVLGVSSEYPELVKLSLHEGRFFDRTQAPSPKGPPSPSRAHRGW